MSEATLLDYMPENICIRPEIRHEIRPRSQSETARRHDISTIKDQLKTIKPHCPDHVATIQLGHSLHPDVIDILKQNGYTVCDIQIKIKHRSN
jgi:hypothetical protein